MNIEILFWILVDIMIIMIIGVLMLIHLLVKEKKCRKMLEHHLDWISEHNGDNIKIEKDEKGNIEKITSTKTFTI